MLSNLFYPGKHVGNPWGSSDGSRSEQQAMSMTTSVWKFYRGELGTSGEDLIDGIIVWTQETENKLEIGGWDEAAHS